MGRFYSVITPVYNRPNEVEELLNSLAAQNYDNFEILIIEDNSSVPSDGVCDKYKDKLNIRYFFREKAGPSAQRNFGFSEAKGDYFILFDSDCIIPPEYFSQVEEALDKHEWDAFGGPDAAHPSFNALQKAISYSMTSFITTGGIRGKKKHVGNFNPRSFNMGLRKEVFQKVGGFIDMHPGEDIDFSLRIIKAGFKVGLIADAHVYHKRRTNLSKFYTQVYRFGLKRIELFLIHPTELKTIHFLPAAFTFYALLAVLALVVTPFWGLFFAAPLLLFVLFVAAHSTALNGSLQVGLLSVVTTFVQMYGYGRGITENFIKKVVLR